MPKSLGLCHVVFSACSGDQEDSREAEDWISPYIAFFCVAQWLPIDVLVLLTGGSHRFGTLIMTPQN